MTIVDIQDAEGQFARYIDEAEHGEVIVVCRHNQPVAELRAAVPVVESPVPERRERKAGLLKGLVRWDEGAFAPMSDEEVAEFEDYPIFPETPPA